MSDFKKRLMFIIGVPLGIILILTIILFLIGSDIVKRTDKIKEIRGELFFRAQINESLALLRKDSQEAKNYVFELNNILPSRDQLITFPRELALIARQNKVDLSSSLGQETSGDSGKLRQTDFTITSQGPFDSFVTFLKSLETARYLMSLKSLDFNRQDVNFKASISGKVFSL
jgi:hypothetical protein